MLQCPQLLEEGTMAGTFEGLSRHAGDGADGADDGDDGWPGWHDGQSGRHLTDPVRTEAVTCQDRGESLVISPSP